MAIRTYLMKCLVVNGELNSNGRFNFLLQRIFDVCIDGKAGLQRQHRNLTVNGWSQSDVKNTCGLSPQNGYGYNCNHVTAG